MPTPLQDRSGPRRLFGRVGRHIHWARNQGVGRLIEEDRLNPFERIPIAMHKARWRRSHDVAPNAVPVFVVGVQRSGTNMLVRGLEHAPEFEVRNENDNAAFDRFLLRPIRSSSIWWRRAVTGTSSSSRSATRTGSHEIVDELGTPSAGRAIWAYRDVNGRVRSAVQKFGAANLDALRRIAAGDGAAMWQAGAWDPNSSRSSGASTSERCRRRAPRHCSGSCGTRSSSTWGWIVDQMWSWRPTAGWWRSPNGLCGPMFGA